MKTLFVDVTDGIADGVGRWYGNAIASDAQKHFGDDCAGKIKTYSTDGSVSTVEKDGKEAEVRVRYRCVVFFRDSHSVSVMTHEEALVCLELKGKYDPNQVG